MLRWNRVPEQTIFGMTVKMYRDPFVAASIIRSPHVGLELDHYAYKYFGSELYMYRILDTNGEAIMEERGDISRVNIYIPTVQDTKASVL